MGTLSFALGGIHQSAHDILVLEPREMRENISPLLQNDDQVGEIRSRQRTSLLHCQSDLHRRFPPVENVSACD
jgi:hypothetical protein